MSSYLRSCAGCSAHILVGSDVGDKAWCAKCRPKHVSPFDAWAAELKVGDRVYVQPIVCPWPNLVRSEWLIRERDGDRLTLSVLGLPDYQITTTVAQIGQHCLARRMP